MIYTTDDARKAFRQIDATNIDSDSYTFKIDESQFNADIVEEGEEMEELDLSVIEKTVEFDRLDKEQQKEAAMEVLRNNHDTMVAGDMPDNPGDFQTIFYDRENKDTYLVDISQYGYEVVREEDDNGEPIRVGYISIFDDEAVRIE